ncbi:hypothetical protein I4U23_015280 [Adineta vaga]|nr:hypothetical protein I4U23_015280 [Adineta vaga]
MQRPGAIKTHLPMGRASYHPSAKYICISFYMFYNTLGDIPKLDFNQYFQYWLNWKLFDPNGVSLKFIRNNKVRNVLFIDLTELRVKFFMNNNIY